MDYVELIKSPAVPVRTKLDVERIVARWEMMFDRYVGHPEMSEMEDDMLALAAIAMEALPD